MILSDLSILPCLATVLIIPYKVCKYEMSLVSSCNALVCVM